MRAPPGPFFPTAGAFGCASYRAIRKENRPSLHLAPRARSQRRFRSEGYAAHRLNDDRLRRAPGRIARHSIQARGVGCRCGHLATTGRPGCRPGTPPLSVATTAPGAQQGRDGEGKPRRDDFQQSTQARSSSTGRHDVNGHIGVQRPCRERGAQTTSWCLCAQIEIANRLLVSIATTNSTSGEPIDQAR